MTQTQELTAAIDRLDRHVVALTKALLAPERKALTPREAAEALGMAYQNVLAQIDDGSLRAIKPKNCRNYIVPVDAIDEFLASPKQLRSTA